MNVSLKIKLTISYVLLSLFLVGSLLFVSNSILQNKFQDYVVNTQEKKNHNIVDLVANEFGDNGEFPNMDVLESIGNTALSQGLILMVTDIKDNQIFCMSNLDSQVCSNMIENMRSNMTKIHHSFDGQYVEKDYDVIKNNQKMATVTLGYYGPYFYNNEELKFIEVLNQVLVGVGILFLLIAALLGLYMANRISRPIREVIAKTRQIEEGHYHERLDLISDTKETNQLIQSVNRLAETLEKQLDSKKRMARDYAHEIRTPLAALQSNLEAMIDGVLDVTPERLEICRTEILRLTKMISDIDKIVQIESDSVKLDKTRFDLSQIIHQVVLNFQPELTGKQIEMDISTSPCEVLADKDKMIQVIINLLSNAIKYTDQGGKIQITACQFTHKAEFVVSDTGQGISEDDIPNIFDHLYRTDRSRDRNTGGSGIGLSVVKAIIDAHGGHIEVKSQLGKGSDFIVTLPL